MLDVVGEVLAEYCEFLPLTARQLFYRLVGTRGYDKTEAAYGRLCEHLNRARRAGLIRFDAIRDDGVSAQRPFFWDGVGDFHRRVGRMAQGYRRDRQDGQPVRLWLLCEAGGMAPMLARAVEDLGVPVLSSGGFDSTTAKHDLAAELAEAEAAEVLHVGDHDPSGVHIFASLAEDVGAFAEALGAPSPVFTRLAVTPAQVAAMSLPTAPPKATDRRAFEGVTTQAEAIPPDALTAIVREAVEARQDASAREALLRREAEERAELLEWSGLTG
ncbi:MAG: hypothetical protein ACU0BS_00695 [Hasllibacter sp.]